ncbi:MAG TPA: tetratricopeptide repeat protein, partial [Nitrospiria bacterium]|nr:tetratricopeptide repeat protein [Nitrospiria bacterium]
MNPNSAKITFNLLILVLALVIILVVVMIARDGFFGTGPKKGVDVSASSAGIGTNKPGTNKPQSLQGPGTPDYVLTPRRLEARSPENGTDPITARLNHEGIAYFTRGEFLEAVKVFEQAYERDRRNITIQHNLAHAKGSLGWTQFDNRHFNDALLNFQEALRLKDQEPFLWLGQGMAYLRLDDQTRAIGSLKKTIELDPSLPDPYKVLGNIYYQLDEI